MRAISASSETPRVTGSSAKENESPSVFPTEELSAVRSALLLWYRKNKRILPWRDTGDPEDVWISEIMLQQTRVEAVKGYFTRFREALPDAFAIAACPEDRLMKLWEGLGYYNRARNLQKCAEVLVRDYGGKLPADHEALLRLPGIGSYTAGAIASIAFGIPVPAVDGNVLRVWSRLTNNADDISLEATKQKFTSEIRPLLASDKGDREPSPVSSSVSDFTQALMELGAVVCVPNGAPLCEVCPLRSCCRAFAAGTALSLPVKAAKKPRRIEERTILILRDADRFFFRKRPSRGLLAGLYEFPGFPGRLSPEEALDAARRLGADPVRIAPLPEGKHIFTHVEWHMTAYEVLVSAFPQAGSPAPKDGAAAGQGGGPAAGHGENKNGTLSLTREELRSFAVPSAFRTWTDWYALRED
ncbi:MAG: A/G-specific adenine glycosylase [Stomatobaculum sp.]|nr:A/G-specific adenine glycosylase [Stomatobaculum sp.]